MRLSSLKLSLLFTAITTYFECFDINNSRNQGSFFVGAECHNIFDNSDIPNILLIGDSITAGTKGKDAAYRVDLDEAMDTLYGNNITKKINWIGKSNFPTGYHHSSWPGLFYYHFIRSAHKDITGGKPNVVMVLGGTNDFWHGATVDTVFGRLQTWVDIVFDAAKEVNIDNKNRLHVVIGTTPGINSTMCATGKGFNCPDNMEENIKTFNRLIPTYVDYVNALKGYDAISVVNPNLIVNDGTGFNPSDYIKDGVHFSSLGNRKLALIFAKHFSNVDIIRCKDAPAVTTEIDDESLILLQPSTSPSLMPTVIASDSPTVLPSTYVPLQQCSTSCSSNSDCTCNGWTCDWRHIYFLAQNR